MQGAEVTTPPPRLHPVWPHSSHPPVAAGGGGGGVCVHMMGGEEGEGEEREEEPMNEVPGPRAPSQSERPARPCLQTQLLTNTSSWSQQS